jgi:hypothetical protein
MKAVNRWVTSVVPAVVLCTLSLATGLLWPVAPALPFESGLPETGTAASSSPALDGALPADPLMLLALQQSQLTTAERAYENLGYSVAVAGDTAVAGAYNAGGAGAAYVFTRSGTIWTQQAVLVASDRAGYDYFGCSVAVDGDTVLIGAYGDDVGSNTGQGSAYVFTRSGTTWTQQAKLTAADATANCEFGSSVDLYGETALVGAQQVGTYTGAAYVFVRSGTSWSQQARLAAADGDSGDYFGASLALYVDTALVGAYRDEGGSAYVFQRSGTTWSQQARLSASDGYFFGRSVALYGTTALVGAPLTRVGSNGSQGAAYVFTRSGNSWSEQAKLSAADGVAYDYFGWSVDVGSNTALVGSYFEAYSGGHNGNQDAAYVYTRSGSTWSQQAKLVGADGVVDDAFSNSVALGVGTALVGAPFDDIDVKPSQGSAYVFVGSGSSWSQQAKLIAAEGGANRHYGCSLAVSGDTAVVGAWGNDVRFFPGNAERGYAYVFVRSGTAWIQQARLTAGTIDDWFGETVAIDGDTILVGASGDDVDSNADQGSAYVFVRSGTTWSLQQRLSADDGAGWDAFGFSLALDGDTALVEAPGADPGSVYVFERTGTAWNQQANIAVNGSGLDGQVALSGSTAVVGAPGDTVGADIGQGSAYVFVRSGATWTQQARLIDDEGAPSDNLGLSVAVSGDTALAGAPNDDVAGNANQGSACVFIRSGETWTRQAKLTADDGLAGDGFASWGSAVALTANGAVIGSRYDDIDSKTDQGSAYAFVRSGTTWSQRAKLTDIDGAADDEFGCAVAFTDGFVLVGATNDDVGPNVDQGSAHSFDLDIVAPVTTATAAPSADATGWNVTPVTVTLSAADYSGSASTFYRLGPSGSFSIYNPAAKPIVTADGTTTVEYSSTDGAGNVEATKSAMVHIDTTAPSTTANGIPSGWSKSAVTVDFSPSDATSGMSGGAARTEFSTNGGATWSSGTSSTITAQGATALHYRSTDAAGNIETAKTATVKIDGGKPTTKGFAAKVRQGKKVKLGYQVNDPHPGSGRATVTLKIYKGKKLKKTIQIKGTVTCNARKSCSWKCTLARGRYTVKVYATDIAGNTQSKVGRATLKVR